MTDQTFPSLTMKPIELTDFFNSKELDNCKIHLAGHNGTEYALDVFVHDRKKWQSWNEHRKKQNLFSKKHIFTLIEFYPQSNMWLFGGIYRINKQYANRYDIELTTTYSEYIGRLKIHFVRDFRARAISVDKYFPRMTVAEILRSPYTGEVFPGYENINHSFTLLRQIYKQGTIGWHEALKNVKGVYLITDQSTGRRYVGAAYGIDGIWSRWEMYLKTGHGGHGKKLKKLISDNGIQYAKDHFKFSLLEMYPMKTVDSTVIERETYWKDVLMTRGEFGYNDN